MNTLANKLYKDYSMLNLKEMIIKNDFSDLINSTEEERKESGGNFYLYTQLVDHIHFDFIRDVIMETFKNDLKILEHVRQQLQEKESESLYKSLSELTREDSLNNICLPE